MYGLVYVNNGVSINHFCPNLNIPILNLFFNNRSGTKAKKEELKHRLSSTSSMKEISADNVVQTKTMNMASIVTAKKLSKSVT